MACSRICGQLGLVLSVTFATAVLQSFPTLMNYESDDSQGGERVRPSPPQKGVGTKPYQKGQRQIRTEEGFPPVRFERMGDAHRAQAEAC